MDPSDILRKNYVRLIEDLDVEPCADYLYQDEVLTKAQFDRCQSLHTRTDKSKFILDQIKGKESFGIFCGTLVRIQQPHLKDILDKTAVDGGARSLLYVNKRETEETHRRTTDALEQRIDSLTEELTQKNNDITHLLEQRKLAENDLREKHELDKDSDKCAFEKQILDLENKLRYANCAKQTVERELLNSKREVKDTTEKLLALQKEHEDMCTKYQAIVASYTVDREKPETKSLEEYVKEELADTCIMCNEKVKDDVTIYRLLCLHLVCNRCWEGCSQTEFVCSKCNLPSSNLEIQPDTTRQNERSLAALKATMTCWFNRNHRDRPAVAYCGDCGIAFCHGCFEIHQNGLPFIKHIPYDVNDLHQIPCQKLLKKHPCDVHEGFDLKMFDQDCKKVICSRCLQEDHKGHATIPTTKAYQQAVSDLTELESELQNRAIDIERQIHEFRTQEDALDINEKDLLTQLIQIRERFCLLLLERQRDVHKDILSTLEQPRNCLNSRLHYLANKRESIKQRMGFVKRVVQYCGETDIYELKMLVQRGLELDSVSAVSEEDRAIPDIHLSLRGHRALEDLLESFISVTCPQVHGGEAGEPPDDIPTVRELMHSLQEAQQSISQMEEERTQRERQLGDMEKLKLCEQHILKQAKAMQERELNEERTKFRNEKMQLMQQINHSDRMVQSERVNAEYLRSRCTRLEEALSDKKKEEIALKRRCDERISITQAEMTLLKRTYDQIQKGLEETVVCVDKHSENRLVVCANVSFNRARLRRGSFDGDHLTNITSAAPNPHLITEESPLETYSGTISTTPVFPLPNRLQTKPVYWEVHSDVQIIRKLDCHDFILETGLVAEGGVDSSTLVYRERSASCVVVKFCTRHQNLCTQIWHQSHLTRCISGTATNKDGVKASFKFGGILDAEKGKFAFLDLSREEVLGCFDLNPVEPVYLTFGVSPRAHNLIVRMKLASHNEIELTADKKSLILKCMQRL